MAWSTRRSRIYLIMLANESRVAVPLHNQALSALLYATSMRAYTCLCDRIEASRWMSALGRLLPADGRNAKGCNTT